MPKSPNQSQRSPRSAKGVKRIQSWARGTAKRGAHGQYANRASPKKKSPVFKRTPSGRPRQSARRYRDDGGKWGDLNATKDKVLARRSNGSPYWAPL